MNKTVQKQWFMYRHSISHTHVKSFKTTNIKLKKCWKYDKLLFFCSTYVVLKIRHLNSTIVPPLYLAFDEPEIAQAIFHHYVTLKLAMDCWSIIIVQDGNFLYHKITSISFISKIQMSPTFNMKFQIMYLFLNFNVVKFMGNFIIFLVLVKENIFNSWNFTRLWYQPLKSNTWYKNIIFSTIVFCYVLISIWHFTVLETLL